MALVKSLVPDYVKRKTYSIRNKIRTTLAKQWWKALELRLSLSGLTIKVESRSDWIIFNEVFVGQSYDLPIRKALKSATNDRCFNILDLGGNVGFFALRAAHIIFQSDNPNIPFKVTSIEGSSLVYKELKSRIINQPLLSDKVIAIHGLVGERQGNAKIFETTFGAGNSLFLRNIPEGVEVPYIDLSTLYDEDAEIDLLKCDIEGSELSFLRNYKDLLAKVRIAVFEFHPALCDVEECYKILDEAGFYSKETLTEGDCPLVQFWK